MLGEVEPSVESGRDIDRIRCSVIVERVLKEMSYQYGGSAIALVQTVRSKMGAGMREEDIIRDTSIWASGYKNNAKGNEAKLLLYAELITAFDLIYKQGRKTFISFP